MLDRSNGLATASIKRNQRMAAEKKAFDEYRDRWLRYADRLAEIRGEPVEIDALVERLLEFEIAVEAADPEQRPAVILNYAGTTYGLPVVAFAATIMPPRQADATDIPADAPDRQAAEQAINEDIAAFADALDASGQPKHPYFAEVANEMRDLAHLDKAKGLQPSLGDLYSRATRLNLDVSAKIGEIERRQATTQRDADERERIAKARAASGSISGAGGGGVAPAGGTIAEIVARAVPDTGW